MSFWDDIQLWQKMLLILACAMVAVLIWGCWQLIWRRMQQRKYKFADLEKSQVVGEASTDRTSKSDEVPFGIRALEAGVEVEGVVISRPTSARTVHNRNPSNLTLMVDGSSSMGSLLGCAQPNSSRNSLGPPSPGSAATFNNVNNVQQPMASPLRAASTRTALAENVAEPYLSRPGPSTRGPSSPPLAYNNRLSAIINSQRRSGTYEGPRPGQPNVYGPSRSPTPPEPSPLTSLSEHQESDPRDFDSSGSNSEDDKQTASTDMRSSSSPSSDEGTGDLTLLQTHRLSHAAEVGQLTRRPPGQARIQSTSSMHSIAAANTPPNGTVYNTASSSVYPMDIAMPSSASLDNIEFQQSQRRTLSTFQYNQHVELAREHFQPQLAAHPRDENVRRADDMTPLVVDRLVSARKSR
ncbi:hypothetical protein EV426DRAFT_184779 [Tirmania nivea]|nr:hypothetical protein EV426DRAFT_184779 [Tirmania nivea]